MTADRKSESSCGDKKRDAAVVEVELLLDEVMACVDPFATSSSLASNIADRVKKARAALRRIAPSAETTHTPGLSAIIEGLPKHVRQYIAELEAIADSRSATPSSVAPIFTQIEDALWALHSYESNRGDARAYSEAEINAMVAAVRSVTPSATEGRSDVLRQVERELRAAGDRFRELRCYDHANGLDGAAEIVAKMHAVGPSTTEGDRG